MNIEAKEPQNPALKPTQLAFVNAYCTLGKPEFQNISKAGIMAGFAPKSAYKSGKRLLAMPIIAQEVAKRLDDLKLDAENATTATRSDITKLSKEFVRECGAKHPNTPRYLDLICRLNGLLQEAPSNQILIYNSENENAESSNLKGRLQRLFKTLGKDTKTP